MSDDLGKVHNNCVALNLLILLVLCSGDPGDSRSPTSLYLTHLALVDLLFVLSYMYDAIALYGVTGTWYSSLSDNTRTSLCYWKEITRPLNISVSIYMLTLLSIDRYIAIVMSTKRTKFYNWARKFRKSVVSSIPGFSVLSSRIQSVFGNRVSLRHDSSCCFSMFMIQFGFSQIRARKVMKI